MRSGMNLSCTGIRPLRGWLLLAACLLAGGMAQPARADDGAVCAGDNHEQALKACTRLIEGKGNKAVRAQAFYNRGWEFAEKKEYDRAIADYSQAIALKPDYAKAFFNRATRYRNKGDLDRAIADYTQAITFTPDDADAFLYRGISYLEKHDYDQAIADFDHTLQIKPDYELAVEKLAAAKSAQQAASVASNSSGAPQNDGATVSAHPKLDALQLHIPDAPPLPALQRVALVIGNSSYKSVTSLPNPTRDADLVGAALQSAGVDVTVVHDLDHEAMIGALKTFAGKADDADWAMIYYAGHGIEMDGKNYLIPTDAALESDRDVPDETISLDRMMTAINGARQLKLVVLDACRNNPFTRMKLTDARRAIDRGLSRVEPASATLVVYAAKEGTTAKDGDGGNSPFAASFAKRIVEPGLEINMAMRFVTKDVMTETGNQQEPFVYGSLPPEPFVFVPAK